MKQLFYLFFILSLYGCASSSGDVEKMDDILAAKGWSKDRLAENPYDPGPQAISPRGNTAGNAKAIDSPAPVVFHDDNEDHLDYEKPTNDSVAMVNRWGVDLSTLKGARVIRAGAPEVQQDMHVSEELKDNKASSGIAEIEKEPVAVATNAVAEANNVNAEVPSVKTPETTKKSKTKEGVNPSSKTQGMITYIKNYFKIEKIKEEKIKGESVGNSRENPRENGAKDTKIASNSAQTKADPDDLFLDVDLKKMPVIRPERSKYVPKTARALADDDLTDKAINAQVVERKHSFKHTKDKDLTENYSPHVFVAEDLPRRGTVFHVIKKKS